MTVGVSCRCNLITCLCARRADRLTGWLTDKWPPIHMRDNADYYAAKAWQKHRHLNFRRLPGFRRSSWHVCLSTVQHHSSRCTSSSRRFCRWLCRRRWLKSNVDFKSGKHFFVRMKAGEETVTKTAGNGSANGQKCGDVLIFSNITTMLNSNGWV